MEARCWLRFGALVLAALFVLNNLRTPQSAALPSSNKTPTLPSSPDTQQLAASAQTPKFPNSPDAQPLGAPTDSDTQQLAASVQTPKFLNSPDAQLLGAPADSAPRDVTLLSTELKPVNEGLTFVSSTTLQKNDSPSDALPRDTQLATVLPQPPFETEALDSIALPEVAPATKALAPTALPEVAPAPVETETLAPTALPELAPANGDIGWPPHKPSSANRYCRHYGSFENKVDFDAANALIHASALAQNQTIVFAAGTNDARNLYAMIGSCKAKLGKAYRSDLLKIFGWEIGRRNFELASKRLPKNPEVHLAKHAISNVDGLVLNISGKDETSGIYPAGSRGIKGTTEQVTTRRYDSLALELNVSEVTFTEIDVEGHEVEAIYSMGLERHPGMFPVFQYELGGTWTDARHTGNLNQTGTAEYLTRLGYRLYIMGRGGMLMPVDVKFFEKAKCPGHKEVGGNALAVLEAAGRSKPWLRKFIDDMVKKEKKLP